jgi:Fe-S-cluster containining protein
MVIKLPKGGDSTLKNFDKLSVVACEPFTIGGKKFSPPKSLTLSPTFWQEYGCYLGCGGCCRAHSLDYTPEEFELFKKIYPDKEKDFTLRNITVNGYLYEFYTMLQHNSFEYWGSEWCGYLDKETGGCGVHQYNPFSCHMELIKFSRMKGNGYIQKKPFGRGWAMKKVVDGEKGILCDFSGMFSLKQFEENDLPVFRRMLAWANYLSIPTYLPDVIHQAIVAVDNEYRQPIRIH